MDAEVVPIYVVNREGQASVVCVIVIAATGLFLKKNWYERLEAPVLLPSVGAHVGREA